MLTGVQLDQRRQKGRGDDTWRRRRVGVGEEARGPGGTGLLRAPGWHELRPDGATKPIKGSERAGDPWRRGITAATRLTADGPWMKSRRDSGGARRRLPRG